MVDVKRTLGSGVLAGLLALASACVEDGRTSHRFSVTFDAEGQVAHTAVGDDPRETLTGAR